MSRRAIRYRFSNPIRAKEVCMRNRKKLVLVLLAPALLFVALGAFAQDLILMHDKGGNPN